MLQIIPTAAAIVFCSISINAISSFANTKGEPDFLLTELLDALVAADNDQDVRNIQQLINSDPTLLYPSLRQSHHGLNDGETLLAWATKYTSEYGISAILSSRSSVHLAESDIENCLVSSINNGQCTEEILYLLAPRIETVYLDYALVLCAFRQEDSWRREMGNPADLPDATKQVNLVESLIAVGAVTGNESRLWRSASDASGACIIRKNLHGSRVGVLQINGEECLAFAEIQDHENGFHSLSIRCVSQSMKLVCVFTTAVSHDYVIPDKLGLAVLVVDGSRYPVAIELKSLSSDSTDQAELYGIDNKYIIERLLSLDVRVNGSFQSSDRFDKRGSDLEAIDLEYRIVLFADQE